MNHSSRASGCYFLEPRLLVPRRALQAAAVTAVSAVPVEEGDEGSAPRPPVEITSGWDAAWHVDGSVHGFLSGGVGVRWCGMAYGNGWSIWLGMLGYGWYGYGMAESASKHVVYIALASPHE